MQEHSCLCVCVSPPGLWFVAKDVEEGVVLFEVRVHLSHLTKLLHFTLPSVVGEKGREGGKRKD